MRKGNVITIAVLAILSLVFLWLWNALGFSFTDPVDLAITIVWWVVIIAVVIAIVERERAVASASARSSLPMGFSTTAKAA